MKTRPTTTCRCDSVTSNESPAPTCKAVAKAQRSNLNISSALGVPRLAAAPPRAGFPAHPASWLVLALPVLFLTACRPTEDPPQPYLSPAAAAFEERGLHLDDAVAEVLERARQASEAEEIEINLPNGPFVQVRRTSEHELASRATGAIARSSWRPRVPDIPPAGEVLHETAVAPTALAAADDGTVFLATDRVLRIRGTDAPETVLDLTSNYLLWDAEGERLAVSAEGEAFLLHGEDYAERTELGAVPTGPMAWDLGGAKLLFFRDHMLLDAEELDRIFLEGSELNLETGELEETGFAPFRRYAAVGTLPTAGIVWGHLRQSHQIDPVPAPLVHIEDGAPVGLITQTTEAADIAPTASATGDLAWVRTHRMGAASTRAYLGRLDGEERPLLLSPAPALHVALSPGGEWGALVTEEKTGSYTVRRFAVEEVRARRDEFARLAEADRRFAGHATTIGARLRDAYASLPEVRTAEEEGTQHFAGEVSPSSIQRMQRALAQAMQRTLGLELDVSPASLAELDAFLDFAAPHLPEEDPAWIAALGFHFGTVLKEEREGRWLTERWSGGLSTQVAEDFGTDELTYAIACPLATARMVLAGETTFRESWARMTSEQRGLPFYLADSLSEEAIDAIELLEFERSGLPPEAVRMGRLRNLLWEGEGLTPAACLFASRVGQNYDSQELRVLGAWRLAQIDPARPAALEALARALADAYETELAGEVYELLLEFSPGDVGPRIEYADLLATLGRFDEASAQYHAAAHYDETDAFAHDLQERLELVERLRADESANGG